MENVKIHYSTLPFYYNPNDWMKTPKMLLNTYANLMGVRRATFSFDEIPFRNGKSYQVRVTFDNLICTIDKVFYTVALGEHNLSILVFLILFGHCSSAQTLQKIISKKLSFGNGKCVMPTRLLMANDEKKLNEVPVKVAKELSNSLSVKTTKQNFGQRVTKVKKQNEDFRVKPQPSISTMDAAGFPSGNPVSKVASFPEG